ncbi:Putative 3TM holin, Phage_holin_3 [Pseudomonas sp. ok272]|uniref:phage holin family protein n=1 Tax=unclassified Pseudomonas TaxID=196821 RepID=UPI0008B5D3E2|nr:MULTISPECIES: phage holin family protein [unclassified Pseudomonas]SEM37175.1 Putative 3TM holin, Phage_holin_3 [Pseudomonas sp. ok272]SFM37543.1 Putative 3TM holin, Phage_holin_3 [Pseudomonas sp. ok602]
MDLLPLALTYVTAAAHLLSAFRLACYQRNEDHYCWPSSLLTSLFGGMFCLAGMDVMLKLQPVSPWHALVSVLLCVLIVRSGGNIVCLWRASK